VDILAFTTNSFFEMKSTNTSDQERNQSQNTLNNSNIHEIEKLYELKEKGIISEAEFQSKKNKLLIDQEALPNSTLILVLGISSIAISLCCCLVLGAFGFIGILIGGIAAVIGLIMAKKAKNTYEQNPGLYTESSYNNINTGRICSIVGLALAVLCLIVFTFVFILYGAAFFASMPNNNFY
jgi:uncharacterized membrane protein YjjP (DUF1212 family)